MTAAIAIDGRGAIVGDERTLSASLARVVARERPGHRLVAIDREPLPTASSWSLERIRIAFEGGEPLELILKDLTREAPGSDAHALKPAEVIDPRREPWVYENILIPCAIPVPRCHRTVSVPEDRTHWILLESIEGLTLSEAGFGPRWTETARWLARFHARTGQLHAPAIGPAPTGRSTPLIRHTHAWHREWFRRARAMDPQTGAPGSKTKGGGVRPRPLAFLHRAHERAIAIAVDRGGYAPLHGEFYPSNVIVERDTGRILPVDWEMAGLGPPLLDLAALCAGLSEEACNAVAEAYRDELSCVERSNAVLSRVRSYGEDTAERAACDRDRFEEELTACGLLLAVQWLGWASGWEPPPEHRFDWLEEAWRCARRLEA